jgi:glycerophosphoryl diester phosphodiesterase
MTGQGISIRHGGRITWLKWHRARKHATDSPFTGARIVEGMRIGASVEVDLNARAGGGFAVLHDPSLDRETTGRGPVAAARPETLRLLRLRANDGAVTNEPLMDLADLTALLCRQPLHPQALLQLDLKTPDADLTTADVAGFSRAVGPLAGQMILSSDDATAVARLAAATPGLLTGRDPCHGAHVARLRTRADFTAFAATALATAPEAMMIYLAVPLVLAAEEAGIDLIAACHTTGKKVDAYTVQRAESAVLPDPRRLLALGVDQITTDDPMGLERLLRDDGIS